MIVLIINGSFQGPLQCAAQIATRFLDLPHQIENSGILFLPGKQHTANQFRAVHFLKPVQGTRFQEQEIITV